MNNEERDIELIERYLEGGLSPGELGEFEQRLKNEPGLDEEVEVVKILMNGIRYSGQKSSMKHKLEKLEASLPDIQSEGEEVKVIPMWRNRMVKSIAATFLILAVSTYLVMDVFSPADHEELFAQNFQPYLNVGNATVRGLEEFQNEEQQAYAAYDSEHYEAAIMGFEKVLQEDDAAMLLYLGNAYLAIGNTGKAEEQFKQLINKDAGLVTQAKWYLSLTYLKAGNAQQAKVILEELDQGDTSYSERAKNVLKDL